MYKKPSAIHHPPSNPPRHAPQVAAFTLIEMTVVIAIIALVLGGGLASFVAWTTQQGFQNTQDRLEYLQQALLDYREVHGRLPCPADITDTQDDAEFGLESGLRGVCEPANFQQGGVGDVVAGLLPVRSLGLPDDYAFDSWGSRLLYSVDRRFTNTGGFTLYGGTISGKVNVAVGSAGSVDTDAVYVLLSHGPNRHGAYPRAGGTIRTAGQSTNDQEGDNCSCDSLTALSDSFRNDFTQNAFSQNTTDANDVFDDIVVFATRTQMERVSE